MGKDALADVVVHHQDWRSLCLSSRALSEEALVEGDCGHGVSGASRQAVRAVSGAAAHTVWAPGPKVCVSCLSMNVDLILRGLAGVPQPRDVKGFLPLAITVGVLIRLLRLVRSVCWHDVEIFFDCGRGQRPYGRRAIGHRLRACDLLRDQRPCR